MDIKQLAERVKSLRNKKIKEQKGVGVDPLAIDIGSEKHDPTSPNQSHVKEGREVSGQQSAGGPRHNPRKRSHLTSLGKLEDRRTSGNQKRTPGTYAEEATEIVKEKIKNKKGEIDRGQTATGQPTDKLDFEPSKPELTTNH